MTIYKPYAYLIGWSKLDRWYYGCSYAKSIKIANPQDLWNTYFTSSKIVKNFRKKYGEPDIIEIRKTFELAEQALAWEAKVICRMRMVDDFRFLNQRDMSNQFRNKGGYSHTEKSKQNYKNSYTETRRSFLSELSKELNKNRSSESRKLAAANNSKTRKENREKYIGESSPLYGLKRDNEDIASISSGTKRAMSDSKLREHLSNKAKLRCTPEWKAKIAEQNKYKISCIKCRREMGRSSLGKHILGKKCIHQ